MARGTSESEPLYCFELKPGALPNPFRGFSFLSPMFLMLATSDLLSLRVKRNRAGKPADGNQAEQFRFARFELENRHCVLRAVADEKFFARFVECQRVRLRAEQVAGILPRANRLHDFIRARVNHAQRVAARIGARRDIFRSAKAPARRRAGPSKFPMTRIVSPSWGSHPGQSPKPSLRWRCERSSTRTSVPCPPGR